MTQTEARAVLEIMRTADGGCSTCVAELYDAFCDAFQGFKDLALELWKDVDGTDDWS